MNRKIGILICCLIASMIGPENLNGQNRKPKITKVEQLKESESLYLHVENIDNTVKVIIDGDETPTTLSLSDKGQFIFVETNKIKSKKSTLSIRLAMTAPDKNGKPTECLSDKCIFEIKKNKKNTPGPGPITKLEVLPESLLKYTYKSNVKIKADFSSSLPLYPKPKTLAEYKTSIKRMLKSLEAEQHIVKEIYIKASFNDKKLSKIDTNFMGAKATCHMFIGRDGNEQKKTLKEFGKDNKPIDNLLDLELFKLACLHKALIDDNIIKADKLKICVDYSEKTEEPTLDFEIRTELPSDLAGKIINCNNFFADLPQRIEEEIKRQQFKELENTGASYNESEKKLDFSYSNQESAFKGSQEVQKYASIIRKYLTDLRKCRSLSTVYIQLNTYDKKESFMNFFSERNYEEEYGEGLAINYQFIDNNNAVKIPTEQVIVQRGEITLLQQELLKLYEIKRLLDLDDTITKIRVNYDPDFERVETQIILIHN